jgi:hypothetical protein
MEIILNSLATVKFSRRALLYGVIFKLNIYLRHGHTGFNYIFSGDLFHEYEGKLKMEAQPCRSGKSEQLAVPRIA